MAVDCYSNMLKTLPVAWTLHDCWSFLGAYYPTHSPTPTPESNKQIDSFWSSEHPNLAAITPWIWLEKQALASKWSRSEITTIHNPVQEHSFHQKMPKRVGKHSVLSQTCQPSCVLPAI